MQRKIDYFDTEEGIEIVSALRRMALDETYNTNSSYSANSQTYPDNLIPFVDKHMKYLLAHPAMDPEHYIANLRLMTRRR